VPRRDVFCPHDFAGLKVAVLHAEGWPTPDVNAAVTLDFGDDPVGHLDRHYEFYLVARPGWDIEQVLGDVGVRVRRGSVVPEPGEFILNGMLPTYPEGKVQHPSVLDLPLVPLPFEAPAVIPPVGFLQLVPFTNDEQRVLESRGNKALTDIFRRRGSRIARPRSRLTSTAWQSPALPEVFPRRKNRGGVVGEGGFEPPTRGV
jgi:hypothetical protein